MRKFILYDERDLPMNRPIDRRINRPRGLRPMFLALTLFWVAVWWAVR